MVERGGGDVEVLSGGKGGVNRQRKPWVVDLMLVSGG